MKGSVNRMNLDEFKARIAPPEGPLAKRVKGIPFSRHDPECRRRETGRPSANCERCKGAKRRIANRKRAKKLAAKCAAEESVLHYKDTGPRKSDSVFAVSGGLRRPFGSESHFSITLWCVR
jgi:hypothetical protein